MWLWLGNSWEFADFQSVMTLLPYQYVCECELKKNL